MNPAPFAHPAVMLLGKMMPETDDDGFHGLRIVGVLQLRGDARRLAPRGEP
ncbi:MAG: hypothetical protein JO099_12515 [Acidobacteriia bacterium]|nr:hypothetical protein [Terriglobia bacterium]